MPFVSVTRLHLSSRSPGFVAGWTSNDGHLAFWTSTVWESLEAMRAFRNSGTHLKVMPKLLRWCDEASFVHWEQADASVPAPDLAFDRLAREGRLSKVNNPSARHRAGQTVSDVRPRAPLHLKKIGG